MIKSSLITDPDKYFESNWLKNIKQTFIEGRVPSACNGCKTREDQGLKSTRGGCWGYSNTGPEPELDISKFTLDKELELKRVELRLSNLCNFKCRMCGEHSSSEIAKEKQSLSIPIYINGMPIKDSTIESPNTGIEKIKQLCLNKHLNKVCLTGGEPFLIKQYYDFMDFLIENKLNENVEIDLFTNCSVYNPKFIERLLKFNKVSFTMSIDGVEKTAEYQRHGTKWNIVRENILRFNSSPFDISFNTAISAYVLLDVSSLAKFLMELYESNNNIKTRCYSVQFYQECHHRFLNLELRKVAIDEINKAITILTPKNYEIFVAELKNIKKYLENTAPDSSDTFARFTKTLDGVRNESFEDVFKLKLY